MWSLDDAYAAYPEAREEMDRIVASARQRGCVCDIFCYSRDEMMAQYDELTPQQRVRVLGQMNPDVIFVEHEARCELRRISMAPYN